jgi:hypothetical protein
MTPSHPISVCLLKKKQAVQQRTYLSVNFIMSNGIISWYPYYYSPSNIIIYTIPSLWCLWSWHGVCGGNGVGVFCSKIVRPVVSGANDFLVAVWRRVFVLDTPSS